VSASRKGRVMSLESSDNIEIPEDEALASPAAAAPFVSAQPKEPPRKRYAAPSAPRVMQFMRTTGSNT